MSVWTLIQIVIQVFFFAALVILWIRLKREPSDDPRLSRALQMVSSKIAVLEDLSRQTDIQKDQIAALIEQKAKQLLEQIERSDVQISKIEQAQRKSMDVAKIFQDKIPHEEIIQRQVTMKYVEAARLAHEGKTIEEIQEAVDLSYAELELITKMNRNQMMMDDTQIPAWIQSTTEHKPNLLNEATAIADQKLKALSEKFSKFPEMSESDKKIKTYQFPRVDRSF